MRGRRQVTLATTLLGRQGLQVAQPSKRGAPQASVCSPSPRTFRCQLWLVVPPTWAPGRVVEVEGTVWTVERIASETPMAVGRRWVSQQGQYRSQHRAAAVQLIRRRA